MKRILSVLVSLMLVLQVASAWAQSSGSDVTTSDKADTQSMGAKGSTADFAFVPTKAFDQGNPWHRTLREIEKLFTLKTVDGKEVWTLNITATGSPDSALYRAVKFDSIGDKQEAFDDLRYILLNYYVPHTYIVGSVENPDMDLRYYSLQTTKLDPNVDSANKNADWKIETTLYALSDNSTDRETLWFERKDPDRTQKDVARLEKLFAKATSGEAIDRALHDFRILFFGTVQRGGKYYLIVHPVRDQKVLPYVASAPADVVEPEDSPEPTAEPSAVPAESTAPAESAAPVEIAAPAEVADPVQVAEPVEIQAP